MKLFDQISVERCLDPERLGYVAMTRNINGVVYAEGMTMAEALRELLTTVAKTRASRDVTLPRGWAE